ncbi:hypothetical protein HMPREF3229_01574 [Peptoniphilus harei]|uniref:Uncharacterized protein n=1 Tax=Peptoniphilus harei TaxID=54005 RepID=A0A133PK76_9FIRM|nr:MazG-like family protein [Peptoniphilus harei]KXA28942.1 hypothetical protein HMPREF3229_01574 [Peptoniphilus harei]
MKVKDLIMKLIYCDPEAEVQGRTYKSDTVHAEVYALDINDIDNFPENVDLVLDSLDHINFTENTIFEELTRKVLDWGKSKDLLHEENAGKQFMKFMEEVFEFRDEWMSYENSTKYISDNYRERYGEITRTYQLRDNMQLEMGDVFVTLIILCNQLNLDPVDCLARAYEKIEYRKGKTINGFFIKQEDLKGDLK